jgi:predicted HicB family RNase H-like nuclease
MRNSMLEYKGYHASVEFDAEDNVFIGEVFGISDSLNFHGESVNELKEMFKQCIDNYLEMCQKIGKEPDKEFKGTFNVRITPELHKKAALEAARQKITLNQYVSNAIDKSFDNAI